MDNFHISGRENIVTPALYLPNRMNIRAGKALHHMLRGKVCYLVDKTFPPAQEIMDYLAKKEVHIEYFDFRNTTSRAVREQVPFLMARSMLSFGMEAALAPSIAALRRGLVSTSPPLLAARVISWEKRANILPFFASAAAFVNLILDHLL